MKISELIKMLQNHQMVEGDIEIYVLEGTDLDGPYDEMITLDLVKPGTWVLY